MNQNQHISWPRRVLATARTLWTDTRGVAWPMGMILVTVLVGIGSLVGLVIVRDQVVQEFGDVAVALDHVDQSFSYSVSIWDSTSSTYVVRWSGAYADTITPSMTDPDGGAPACLNLLATPIAEGGTLAAPAGTIP